MEKTTETTKRKRVLKNAQYKCGYCGEFGHNTRTCPKKKADEAAKKDQAVPVAE